MTQISLIDDVRQQITDLKDRIFRLEKTRSVGAHGSLSVTVTGSTVSATQTVNHGLGQIPSGVQLTLRGTSGFGAAMGVNLVADPTSTHIQFEVDFSVATSGTFVVYWDVKP